MKHTTITLFLILCSIILVSCNVQQKFEDNYEHFKDRWEDATVNLKESAKEQTDKAHGKVKDQVKEKLHLKYMDERNMPKKAGEAARGFKKSLEHLEKILHEGSQAVTGKTRKDKTSHAYKAMRETLKLGTSMKDIAFGFKDIAMEGAKDAGKEAYKIYRKHGSKGEKIEDVKNFALSEIVGAVNRVKSELKKEGVPTTVVERVLGELSTTVDSIKEQLGRSSLKQKEKSSDESSDE